MLLTEKELEILKAEMPDAHILFCYEYIKDFNGSRAAEAAGYSPNAPGVSANRLLKSTKVRKLLNHLKLARMKRVELSGDMVVQELAKIAFQDTADFIDHTGGNVRIKDFQDMGENTKIIKTVKTAPGGVLELVLHDKMKALELLGRHFALFTDNVNNTNNGGDMPTPTSIVNINVNHRKPGELIEK